jgi:hypothetical protein
MVKKATEVAFLSFCYEVCLTLGCFNQAANAKTESFAFKFFVVFGRVTPNPTASTLPSATTLTPDPVETMAGPS